MYRKFLTAAAALGAVVMLAAGVAHASDLKSDLNTATNSPDRNKDLGNVVGGQTYTFPTGIYFTGGHSSVTFAADVLPSFVTSATGGTVTGSGISNAVSSTITVVAPCQTGAFGGEDVLEPIEVVAGKAVTYKVTASSGSGGWDLDDAFVNIKGTVTSLGANCATSPTFDGFYAPVDATNTAKAGQGVPFRWNLLDGTVKIEDAAGDFSVTSVAKPCELTGGDSEPPVANDAGSSALRWDDESAQYVFVWKTNKSWANTCRTFEVSYQGTVVGTADFRFTK